MQKRYPHQLSYGANNYVTALNEEEAAKIFTGDTRSDIGSEAEKMKYANKINGLVVKFIRIDYDENLQADILVMERLNPLDYRGSEVEKRELWMEVFEDEMKQLHAAGWVHRHLRRPSNLPGGRFDNIFLTQQGIRLIDTGIAAMRHKVGDKLFNKYVEVELGELKVFKEFFLDR
jgi:serine/threonine protein kinase